MSENRARFAQNFLRNPSLVASLLRQSSLCGSDLVLEIGPGEGVLTDPLSKIVRRVIAVEIDPQLTRKLRERFPLGRSNVEVVCGDFAGFIIPAEPCKVFANIPFNQTASILRRVFASPQISEAYLLLQREAAQKYSGVPREFEVSVLAKPFYRFKTVHCFSRTDFDPVPNVDSVMLRMVRLQPSLIPSTEDLLYRGFVRYGFRSTRKNLRLAYRKVFTFPQWKRLSRDLQFHREATASELTFEQWLGIFRYFVSGVSHDKRQSVSH
jgi:23S rRNA (adenine-N6)-dimethyltransferase